MGEAAARRVATRPWRYQHEYTAPAAAVAKAPAKC